MSRKTAVWLLILIVLIGTGVRSYHLTSRSLWFDEAFSWRLIQFPITEMIARDATDVHPPLYYILLQGWSTVFGTSLLAIRSFSVFLSSLTIVAAYLLVATGFKSRSSGLLAAILIAVSGFQIQYGWEARMYTLGTALALWSTFALLKAVRGDKLVSLGWWVAYAISAALLMYTHYYAFFTVAAHVLFVLGFFVIRTRGRLGEIIQASSFWYGVLAAVLIFLLYLPWIPTFLAQNSQVQASYWIPPIGGWVIPDTFYRLFFPTPGIPPHDSIIGIISTISPMAFVFLGTILLIFLARQRQSANQDAVWVIVLSAFVPFIISITISLLSDQSLYQDRFFVFAHLFILAGAAALPTLLPGRWLRWGVSSVLVTILVSGSASYWQELKIPSKPGARAAVASLFDQRRNNEPIIVSSPFVFFSILYYAEQEHNSSAPKLYSESGELAHFAGGPILKPSDIQGSNIFNDPQSALWVVDTSGFGGQPLNVPSPWQIDFEQSYPEVFSHQGDITIRRYTK
jgi:mannosyltransferase